MFNTHVNIVQTMKGLVGILICLLAVSSKCNCSTGSVSISGTGTAYEGGSIIWSCSGSGCSSNECSYTWTSSLLGRTVSGTQLRQSNLKRGSYSIKCSVYSRNSRSSSSTYKSLRVYYGPSSISITPNSPLTVNEGSMYGSSYPRCQAHGCEGCTARWTLGGVQKTSGYTLFSSSVTADRLHTGTYTCEVWNTYSTSSKQSQSLEVIVNYPPDVRTAWNATSLKLSCEALGVPASYNFRLWSHVISGVTIRQIVGVRKSADTLLHSFDRLTYEDSGDYICSVDNGVNSSDTGQLIVQQAVQSLLVYGKPAVIEFVDTHNVSKKDSVNVSFEIYAVIRGTLKLSKLYNDGKTRLIPSSEYKYNSEWSVYPVPFYGKKVNIATYRQTVTIPSVEEDFFGNLTVRFENPQGISEVNITLVPKGVPDIPTNLSIVNTAQSSATLVFTTGFANGPNQWVVIEFKSAEVNSNWYNGVSVEAGVPSNVTILTTVSGLASDTHYLFRAYANNLINTSDYTEEYVSATTLSDKTESYAVYIAVTIGVTGGCGVILTILAVYLFKRKGLRFGTSKKQINANVTGKEGTRGKPPENTYEDLRHSTLGMQSYEATTVHVMKQTENVTKQEDDQKNMSTIQRKWQKFREYFTNKNRNEVEKTIYEDLRKSRTLDQDCYEPANVRQTSSQQIDDPAVIAALEATLEIYTDDVVPAIPKRVKIKVDCNFENDKACSELADGVEETVYMNTPV